MSSLLPFQTRVQIVLTTLLQSFALQLMGLAEEMQWAALTDIRTQIVLCTLILTVPTAICLLINHQRSKRLWWYGAGMTILFSLLALNTAWNASGAPGINSSNIIMPFVLSAVIAWFVLLPWLQIHQDGKRWDRTAYPALFEYAWQNALTLILAAVFSGIFWLVLQLWAQLFVLIGVQFFEALFNEPFFIHAALGIIFGVGILIGRSHQVARDIFFAIFKGLLPVLATAFVLFIVALPITGLTALWEMRSATSLMVAVIAVFILFLNAVYQEGNAPAPYARYARWLVNAGIGCLPIFATLALYALSLRIEQYGWTPHRICVMAITLVLSIYSFGYAWAVLQRRTGWMAGLQPVNMLASWFVIVLIIALNTPLLDPYRISIASQLGRLNAGHISPAEFDKNAMRFDFGRRGYEAVVALQENPLFKQDEAQLAELKNVVAQESRWSRYSSDDETDSSRIQDIATLKQHIQLADNAAMPDDDWWNTILQSAEADQFCILPGTECILVRADLNADTQPEALLCEIAVWRTECQVSTKTKDGWQAIGTFRIDMPDPQEIRQTLQAGKITPIPRAWADIRIGESMDVINLELQQKQATPVTAE